MSLFSDILDNLKRIVVLDERVGALREDVGRLDATARDHEKRLVRIETLIEVAQAQKAPRRIAKRDDE